MKYLKEISIIILSILVSVGLCINLNTNAFVDNMFIENSGIISLIVLIAFYYAFKKITNIKDKRSNIISIILAILFSLFTVVVMSFNMYV